MGRRSATTKAGAGPRRRAVAAVLVGLAVAATGCSPGESRSAPPPAPVVDVAMSEYEFSLDDQDLRAGRIVFRARNLGRLDHELLLVELPEDFPPVAQQLRAEKRRPVSNVGRVPIREPGATGTFAADLVAGRYALVCFVRDADGNQHAVKGMARELRVR